jgi:hypothetical protein
MVATQKLVATCIVFSLMLLTPAVASDKPRPAPPVDPAAKYPDNDPHANEKVTLAAEPCIDKLQCPFFRLPYIAHGFLPVRVIITNDRDDALNLDEARMQFYPAGGEKEGAATDEDLNRRLFSTKGAHGSTVPILGIPIHHEPVDKKILNDEADFGFQSTVIPPHSTRAGYVFYDIRGLDDPVLPHSELYVKEIHYTDAQNVRHELFGFTLPFDKWLAAQPKPEAKSETAK